MDFPTSLESPIQMVSGLDELQATIYHLLKNELGSLLQSMNAGSYISIHATEEELIPQMIAKTIEEIPQTQVLSCTKVDGKDNTYTTVIQHKSDTITSDLNLSNL